MYNSGQKEAAHRYFEGVCLDGFLGATADVVCREADGISLSRPSESHLGRGDRRLRRVLVVAVDEVGGEEDGDNEGEEQSRGDDGLTHFVTYGLWKRAYCIDRFRVSVRFILELLLFICDNSPSSSIFSQKHFSE